MEEEVRKIKPVFVDDRGTITDILEEVVGHVGIITSKAGSIRAKHYHKESTQYTYVINGKVEFKTNDFREENSKIKSVILESGDLIITPPMIVHKMIFLEDTVFLDMTTKSRKDGGFERDTIRVDI